MASQVNEHGVVEPPLNITRPAPLISLRGFQWSTVDEKILGAQLSTLDKTVAGEAQQGGKPSSDDSKEPQSATQKLEQQKKLLKKRVDAVKPVAVESVETPDTSLPSSTEPVADDDIKTSELSPSSSTLPAPRMPDASAALPLQLPAQLGLAPGLSSHPAPDFPLSQFQGAYAGNGFNCIFRPRGRNDQTVFEEKNIDTGGFPDDNILELNLTTEQLTFGPTIGQIPNRGLVLNGQEDIILGGFPYLQTIQDVTNPETGKGDSITPTGIHFETGMWLTVPASTTPPNEASVVRMASIPHGTSIVAQSLTPKKAQEPSTKTLGGRKGHPDFEAKGNKIDTTPFPIGGDPVTTRFTDKFRNMKVKNTNVARIPQDLTKFDKAGTITDDIIKNPNLVLKAVIDKQKIVETITFEVSTGTSDGKPEATLSGGGTTNISFLNGPQDPPSPVTTAAPDPVKGNPNAHAPFMSSKFWIETVEYKVRVPKLTTKDTVLLRPIMASDDPAPTPVFAITPPKDGVKEVTEIAVPGVQIQYSQTVMLNFGGLSWPHVSVATLVPTDPQPFSMT